MKNSSRAWELIAREMDEGLSPQEQAELEAYLADDFDLAAQRQMLRGISPVTATELPSAKRKEALLDAILEQGRVAVEEETPAPRKPLIRMRTWWAAATLAGLTALGYWMWTNASRTVKWEEVATRVGTRMHLELPDGTKVTLNAGSRLSYPAAFSGDERVVRLTGEAYFNVVASPNKPFLIHTADMDVRVLGTELNLKAYPEDRITETALITGAVEVMLKHDGGKRVVLKPMQKIRVEKQPVINTSPAASPAEAATAPQVKRAVSIAAVMTAPNSGIQQETAWMEDQLVFRDERFDDLALRIQRIYGMPVVFKNEAVRNYVFSGTIRGESIGQVLHIFQQIHPFEYTIADQQIIIK